MKFGKFLKDLFTKDVPIKLLAIAVAIVTVIFINV